MGAKIKICKQAGKVANLAKTCENSDVKGTLGIAHTGGKQESKRQKSAAPKAAEGEAKIKICKQAGKVANLAKACENSDVKGTLGIAHTRWATHGPPTDRNSHPHVSCDGKIAV